MNIFRLKEQKNKIPPSPGIYMFKNSNNKILYIGKALNLKNRVSHYSRINNPRLKRMIQESTKIGFIKTDSEIEALILESEYIKKYKPPFNIVMRDDKQYFYVNFTQEKFPKIFLNHQPYKIKDAKVRDLELMRTEYVGPFTDGNALRAALRLFRKIFPYCTCRQLHNNYCLNYHIGKCLGFCCLKIKSVEDQNNNLKLKNYKNNIRAIRNILSGKKESITKQLEKEMQSFAKKEEFEKAIELKVKIEKLKQVFQNAKIINEKKFLASNTNKDAIVARQLSEIIGLKRGLKRIESYDIANIQGKHAVGVMVVFDISNSLDKKNLEPNKNQYRKFKIQLTDSPNDTAMLQEVLIRRLNHSDWPHPEIIMIDGGRAQFNVANNIIANYKLPIAVIALTKNEKHLGSKLILSNKKALSLHNLRPEIRNFLIGINAETHRFAINYYRKQHTKTVRVSH